MRPLATVGVVELSGAHGTSKTQAALDHLLSEAKEELLSEQKPTGFLQTASSAQWFPEHLDLPSEEETPPTPPIADADKADKHPSLLEQDSLSNREKFPERVDDVPEPSLNLDLSAKELFTDEEKSLFTDEELPFQAKPMHTKAKKNLDSRKHPGFKKKSGWKKIPVRKISSKIGNFAKQELGFVSSPRQRGEKLRGKNEVKPKLQGRMGKQKALRAEKKVSPGNAQKKRMRTKQVPRESAAQKMIKKLVEERKVQFDIIIKGRAASSFSQGQDYPVPSPSSPKGYSW